MTRRDPRWIRRRTTVDDLLDDGIENGSDLSKPHLPGDPDSHVEASVADRRNVANRDVAANAATHHVVPISFFGVFLGSALTAAGIALIVWPVDMLVEHVRMRYLLTTIEHVTQTTSRMYGAAVSLAGMAILGFALYRRRR